MPRWPGEPSPCRTARSPSEPLGGARPPLSEGPAPWGLPGVGLEGLQGFRKGPREGTRRGPLRAPPARRFASGALRRGLHVKPPIHHPLIGRGDDAVGSARRAQISQFELRPASPPALLVSGALEGPSSAAPLTPASPAAPLGKAKLLFVSRSTAEQRERLRALGYPKAPPLPH